MLGDMHSLDVRYDTDPATMTAAVRSADGEQQVLLVEDDAADALLFNELVSIAGEQFSITHVTTMGEALPLAASSDCAVVDLGLPDAAGVDAVTTLRAEAPQLAIVVLTGSNDRSRAIAAVGSGAQDYLVKGEIDGDRLAKAIRYAVERRRAEVAEQQLLLAQQRQAEIRRLSRGLLPLLHVSHHDLDVAVCYRPGASAELGGDFFDAVTLPDGSVRAVIGDVCGHGPLEAALGVALRIAWRTMVVSGAVPEDTIASVATMLQLEREDEGLYTTLCDITFDPGRRKLAVRRHGHPPPLLLSSQIEWVEPGSPAMPIGFGAHRPAAVELIDVPPAASVLLLTDGIYEGRHLDGRLGMEGLRVLVSELVDRGLTGDALLEALVRETALRHGGDLDDDVALLWLGTS